jgi:hypothetical protein
MKILSYSGESVLTSDRIGDAVIDYARALAAENAADVIDIPVVNEGGTGPDAQGIARLLVGPTSQLIIIPAHGSDVRIRDSVELEALRAKLDALTPSRITASDDQTWWEDQLGFEFL